MAKKIIKKESNRSYKIDSVSPEDDRIVVYVSIFEDGKKIHEIRQGFDPDTDIEEGVRKAGQVFFEEREMAKVEQERMEKEKEKQKIIDNLEGKEGVI
ncbi:MAG: hypothetical protein PHQ46_10745 [Negativicutes bacterium]|nr:hypothetical protein [Negativicutes bacterium]